MARTVSGRVVVRMLEAKRPEPERIFVSIASYRDTECQWTVRDLFLKAAKPERVFVGICWQVVPQEDGDCFEIPSPRPLQTRLTTFHVEKSEGVGWARTQAHKLWRGEEYVLNIDSHMRFVEGWDERMIEQLKSCQAPKPMLSVYPPGYVPPDTLNPPALPVMTGGYFDEAHIPINKSRTVAIEDAPPSPFPSMLYAAGFAFSSSLVLKEVPYDPFIYFQGEEISMATRLWTHGWDMFAPNQVLIYHAYGKHTKRRTHWVDNRDWPKLNARSRSRVAHLIGSQSCQDAEALKNIEAYALGTARSIEDFQRQSGIDFKNKIISVSAALGQFPLVCYDPGRDEMRSVFNDLWRSNTYGNIETRSGSGSTLRSTRSVRDWLKDALARLGVRSLADAGCGDAVWISRLVGALDLYIGIELVEAQIEINARLHQAEGNMLFKAGDLVRDPPPKADMILCRDVLGHLPDADILKALACFRQSGAKYLMATHFPAALPSDVKLGGWRAVNLEAPPFLLGPPIETFFESREAGKTLSVWQFGE